MSKKSSIVSLVVAVAEGGVIGVDGGLAWKISDDLKHFKKVTMGKPVIMGRKTFASIGRPLPGRFNVVITRSPEFSHEGVHCVSSIEDALTAAEQHNRENGKTEICIIGGAEIYAQTLAHADRIYLTRVAANVAGDSFFPAIDSRNWREFNAGGCVRSDKNDYDCQFFTLERSPLKS